MRNDFLESNAATRPSENVAGPVNRARHEYQTMGTRHIGTRLTLETWSGMKVEERHALLDSKDGAPMSPREMKAGATSLFGSRSNRLGGETPLQLEVAKVAQISRDSKSSG